MNVRCSLMAGAAVAVAAIPNAGCAQGASPARLWSAEMSWSRETHLTDDPGWTPGDRQDLAVYRRFASGALGVGAVRVTRFGRSETGGVADGYRTLWPRAYANVRLQATGRGEVLPTTDVAAELFQGFRGGWEPSLTTRHLTLQETGVWIAGGSLARYVGDAWLGRVRGSASWQRGEKARPAVSATVRRYLGSGGEFAEVAGGTAEEAVVVAGAGSGVPLVESRGTRFVEGTVRWFPWEAIGGTLGVGHYDFEGIPGRLGIRAGLLARW